MGLCEPDHGVSGSGEKRKLGKMAADGAAVTVSSSLA